MSRATLLLMILTLALPASLGAAEVVLSDAPEPLAVRVVESIGERTVLEYQIGSFTKTPIEIDGETYYTIGLGEESRRLEKGMPEIPNVRRSIVIPDDAEMRVRVVSSHYVDYTDIAVAPSKGVLLRNVDPATVPRTFDALYDGDEWYPADLAGSGDPYIMRDCRGLVVELNPIQYNPATRTLRVHDSVVLEVAQVGPGKTNVLTRRPSATMNAEFRKIYERHFLNFSDTRLARYSSVGEVGNMLVICYGPYMSTMQPLVDWKNQMGVPCEMVSVADAGGSSSGIDSYIQNYYDTNGLAFVLLVGDAAQCPTPTASGGSSDPSYSLVAGSDNYPDLFVGRFSAESASMVETQVERTVEYEKLPQPGGAWYHKGFGVASNQGTGDDGEYDNEHVDNIRADLLGFTYTEVDQIYDPSGTSSQVSSALNNGRSVGNYCGHGSITSWSSTGFSNTRVNALTNDNMLPFIVSVACVNGYFDGYTCFGEAWLRATNGGEPTGAVGFYASSVNQSWNPPMCAQDESADLLVAGAKRTFGGLCYNGSCQMMDEYGTDGQNMFLTWHIFGDPSLRVRTDTPASLSVSHDANVSPDATSFDVTVTGEEGALCALYYSGVLYGSALTNGSGAASIPLAGSLPSGVDLTLTVTSFNAMPYFGTATVSEPYVPVISVDPTSFEMTLEPGETDTDTMTISNTGEALSTLSFDIEIVDATPRRSLAGSTMAAVPSEYAPGTTETFTFSMSNASTDQEWVKSAELDFPSGVTVNSATDFVVSASGHTLPCDGQTGDGVTVTWTYTGTWGIIYGGETAMSDISLTVDSGFTGPIEVAYTLYGDIYGSEPHDVSGTVTIDPPAGPTVTLLAPNGGEIWGIGETHSVTWDWFGSFSDVSLTCSSDGGSTWWDIIGSTPNDGSYSWTVDGPVSDDCLVKVTGLGVSNVFDTSNSTFSIYRPVTWLTASPLSGDVAGIGSLPVELTFDSTDLPDGEYLANIHIDSNGGDRVVVPVTLHVETSGVVDPWPDALMLYGNYPNPFNPTTKLAFAVPAKQRVRVDVYDISGRHVKTVADRVFGGGRNEVVWDGTNKADQTVASGVYIYTIESGDVSRSAKMVLTK